MWGVQHNLDAAALASADLPPPALQTTLPAREAPAADGPSARRWRVLRIVLLAAYAGLVFFTAAHHEPWFDEAQSWLIARDCPLPALLTHVLRYEGTPGLWHVLLMPFARPGFPYAWFNYLSAAIAVGGVGLFLAYSPLPRWMTALLPFTYFLAYQYAVVARQYVLLAPLLFLIACAYRGKDRRPLLLAGLLALLAHTSVYGLMLAAAIALGHFADMLRQWQAWGAAQRWRHLAGGVLLIVAAAAALAVIWPAADNRIKPWGGLIFAHPLLRTGAALDEAWFSQPAATAVLLLVSCAWFYQTGVLLTFLGGLLGTTVLFVVIRVADHHTGIALVYWLFCLWLSFDRRPQWEPTARAPARRAVKLALLAVVAGLCLRQIYWTACAVRYDVQSTYCGAEAAARYIRQQHLDRQRIGVANDMTIAILPYFSRNIFANFDDGYGGSFVNHADACHSFNAAFAADSAFHDSYDVIIVAIEGQSSLPWGRQGFAFELAPAWAFDRYFPGITCWKDRNISFMNPYPRYSGYALYRRRPAAAGREPAPPEQPTMTDQQALQFAAQAPRPDDVRIELGTFHDWLGVLVSSVAPQAATDHFRSALRCNPRDGNAHYYLAALIQDTDPAAATEHYRQAVEAQPDNAPALNNYAAMLIRNGQLDLAAFYLRRAVRLDPHNAAFQANFRSVLEAMRQTH